MADPGRHRCPRCGATVTGAANLGRHVARCAPCPGCGGPKRSRSATCAACRPLPGGELVAAVADSYPEESARSIAERLGTTEMAVYNTASRMRRRRPGSVGYRHPRD